MGLGVDMNRNEWKALHHSVRADTRAFRLQYGGWPCFSRVFYCAGRRWHIERSFDREAPNGRTFIWSALADHARQLRAIRICDVGWYRRDGDIMAARRTIATIRANAIQAGV